LREITEAIAAARPTVASRSARHIQHTQQRGLTVRESQHDAAKRKPHGIAWSSGRLLFHPDAVRWLPWQFPRRRPAFPGSGWIQAGQYACSFLFVCLLEKQT
jgi:hypothetical protein